MYITYHSHLSKKSKKSYKIVSSGLIVMELAFLTSISSLTNMKINYNYNWDI